MLLTHRLECSWQIGCVLVSHLSTTRHFSVIYMGRKSIQTKSKRHTGQYKKTQIKRIYKD